MNPQEWAGLTVSILTIITTSGLSIRWLVKHYLVELKEEFKQELEPLIQLMDEIDRRNLRIEYALYNEGHTGLINKVEELLHHQQVIKVDVEVMKSKRNG